LAKGPTAFPTTIGLSSTLSAPNSQAYFHQSEDRDMQSSKSVQTNAIENLAPILKSPKNGLLIRQGPECVDVACQLHNFVVGFAQVSTKLPKLIKSFSSQFESLIQLLRKVEQ
jgi:hypothetical protein